MKALEFATFGEPVDVIALADAPTPEPPAGHVRLKLVRSPIHNHDLATIRGVYGVKPPLPAIGGTEMLGIVDALGDGAGNVTVGQRVAAMTRGAWAEYALVPATGLVPLPDAISDDAGAQLLAMPLSAVVLFDTLAVKAGDWIVQNAANGAVGRILMRVAQDAGVNVINLVRRQSAADELASYGAKHVVIASDDAWPQRVRELAGSAEIVRAVDSVCDAQSMPLNRLLAPFGEHVIFGALSGRALALDPGALIFGQTVVRGFWMSAWMTAASDADRLQAMQRVFGLAMQGQLPLPVASVHPLADAAAALKAAETPGRPGKVLLAL
ncbi:MAG: zinc-binding dehydrogenase [Candidatus Eremiobacteraeota bacterium]|nr:zinc-binding dehydrogenase [Candidatus Eremiobacteraeota bacterium]